MDLYAEQILEHHRRPQKKTPLAAPSVTHHENNPTCGDEITVQLLIEDAVIRDIGWAGEGCAISQAGMSLLAPTLIGKTPANVGQLSPADVRALLGVPVGPRRFKCALLALHTIKNALRTWHHEPPLPWVETVGADRELVSRREKP